MMPRFLERIRDDAVEFDSAFLECLASKEHRSRSRVWFILARTRPSPPEGSIRETVVVCVGVNQALIQNTEAIGRKRSNQADEPDVRS